MELRVDARIPFLPRLVFVAYRDEPTKLLPYLPNVRRIDVKSRKEQGTRVEAVNEWQGGGEIPGPVRAVLGDAMLGWTDYAIWDEETLRCDWRTETNSFRDAIRCQGQSTFVDEGGATRLEVRGSLEVDARKIRGVPGILAGRIGRAVEEFLVQRIQANLLETAAGLAKYLASAAGGKPNGAGAHSA